MNPDLEMYPNKVKILVNSGHYANYCKNRNGILGTAMEDMYQCKKKKKYRTVGRVYFHMASRSTLKIQKSFKGMPLLHMTL